MARRVGPFVGMLLGGVVVRVAVESPVPIVRVDVVERVLTGRGPRDVESAPVGRDSGREVNARRALQDRVVPRPVGDERLPVEEQVPFVGYQP